MSKTYRVPFRVSVWSRCLGGHIALNGNVIQYSKRVGKRWITAAVK